MPAASLSCFVFHVLAQHLKEPDSRHNKMPFLAEKHVPIPNKDLLSWMYDEPKFDQDKPVSRTARYAGTVPDTVLN